MKLNLNALDLNERSDVLISAAEITTVGDNPRHPLLGDANVWVSNIAPHRPPSDPNHGVEYDLNVDSDEDLNTLKELA